MKRALLFLLALLSTATYSQEKKAFAVFFDHNEKTISRQAAKTLDSIIKITEAAQDYSVAVTGYTDETGSSLINASLSRERADVVREHLIEKGVDAAKISASGIEPVRTDSAIPERAKRKAGIVITYMPLLGIKYQPKTFMGARGTMVTVGLPSGQTVGDSAIAIKEYFSVKEMLEGGMNAVASDGNILQTAGMITINETSGLDIEGGYYIVQIPVQEGKDREMSVWLDNEGTGRWTKTKIKISGGKNYYEFRVPVGRGTTRINLDKYVNVNVVKNTKNKNSRNNGPKVVYITTYKDFGFNDVKAGYAGDSLVFSAKLKATEFAFAKPRGISTRRMTFKGVYKEGDANREVVIRLNRCRYFSDNSGNLHYDICEKCLIKKSGQVQEETGFFAWLKRVFKGSES